MNDIIKQLRNEFNKIEGKRQEGNVKDQVTKKFLEYCGYDMSNCESERYKIKGYSDMYIPTIDNKALIVEVKNGYESLNDKDISQLRGYVLDEGQRFGILTNGYEYVLLDFSIEVAPRLDDSTLRSYVVFWFDIFQPKGKDRTELKYFKYLTFENLYKNQSTYFFSDIAQYRIWKQEQGIQEVSWVAYRCTLYRFFDYYALSGLRNKNYEQMGKRAYEDIGIEVFEGYIKKCLRNGMNTSTRTLNNNYTHIYNMLYELKRHGKMGRMALNDSRKKSLEEFAETQERKQFTEIDAKDIQTVLNYLKRKKHSTRNIVVFLLVATMGMERSQLIDLKWENIDKSYKYIWVSGRKIDVCPILQEYLAKLNKETKVRGKNPMFVFRVFYKNQYRKITESKINDIFDDLIHISDDDKWKYYSPKYVRNCLIGTLYRSGYKLEDIMYITGIDITNISKYIKVDELLEQRSKKTNWQNLYNGILCECE